MSTADSEAELRLVARSFSAVGHELAGPLQTAVNSLFVLERMKAAVPPELTAPLRALEVAMDTLRTRLDRLLRLPQAFLATREELTLGEVIELSLHSLGARADQVTVLIEPAEKICVDGNAAALALGELLLNALEAGGPVSLAAGLEGQALVLRVTNRGPGFPPSALDPFYSASAKALGLGLPLARAVALSHAGTLRLTDEGGLSMATLTLAGAHS